MSGVLHLVATPIGNLGDITLRALAALRSADAVICEDTRRTRRLLEAHGIHAQVLSMPAFEERQRAEALLDRLERGETLALCTDAGSPGVSDPGQLLVALALERGLEVTALPGPSAAIAALQLSGLPSDRFFFAGFLPRKGGGRRRALAELERLPATVVLFESPRRLHETLLDLAGALGDRRAAVARELTKLHEEVVRGRLSELAARFAGETLGEVAVVVEGAEPGARPAQPAEDELEPLDDAIRRLADQGLHTRELARRLAQERRIPAREIYARALKTLRSR
ncbi:MAG: 16S rRNA (cytidine(1402)-2'-O)-methyltransferase [Myxococcales bacterium]